MYVEGGLVGEEEGRGGEREEVGGGRGWGMTITRRVRRLREGSSGKLVGEEERQRRRKCGGRKERREEREREEAEAGQIRKREEGEYEARKERNPEGRK
jgi:hypothetical protein